MPGERFRTAPALAFASGAAGLGYLNLGASSLFFWIYAGDGQPRASAAAVGVAAFVAQLAGAFASVALGHLSDQYRARGGRRGTFLAASLLPTVLCSVAVLAPPIPGTSPWNAAWLALAWSLAAAGYSAYCAGFLPLFAEVASGREGRLSLSAAMATGTLAGSAVALFVPPWMQSQEAPTGAALSMLLALPALLPPLWVREPAVTTRSGPLGPVLRTIARDPDLLRYGVRVFWMFALLQALLVVLPYVPTLLDAPGTGLRVNALFLAGVFAGLPAIVVLARRQGTDRTLRQALVALALALGATLLAVPALRAWPAAFAVFGLAIGASAASLFALPHAMLGDRLSGGLARTGYSSAGLAFGLQGVVIRGGSGFAAVMAGVLLPWGATTEAWTGIGAIVAASVGCALLAARGRA